MQEELEEDEDEVEEVDGRRSGALPFHGQDRCCEEECAELEPGPESEVVEGLESNGGGGCGATLECNQVFGGAIIPGGDSTPRWKGGMGTFGIIGWW